MGATNGYIALLERLNDEIHKKRPHFKKKKVLFHQDNAPVHESIKTTAKLHELGYELLLYPPYSPDLAFSVCRPQNNACWKEI
jgi:[histone H3]-lysine36 N-dimethyltransferase SETMAR